MAPLRHAVHILPDVMMPAGRPTSATAPRSRRLSRNWSCSPTTWPGGRPR